MEPVSATATSGAPVMPGVGFDVVTPLVDLIAGNVATAGFLGAVLGILSILWSVFAVLAYLVTIIFIGLYVYASIQKQEYEGLETEELRHAERMWDEANRSQPKNDRLQDVLTHSQSGNPNDWKLAIIEADIILDGLLQQRGYAGNSLGERLKSVSPQQIESLNDAWEAHKVRNRIAHEGADFVLTRRITDETIARYQRVFAEFGIR